MRYTISRVEAYHLSVKKRGLSMQTIHITRDGSKALCGSSSAQFIHEHYAAQAVKQGMTHGKLCEACVNATHDYKDSDHCLSCGAECYESPSYYLPCSHDFDSTAEEQVIDYLKSGEEQ